MSNHLAKRKEIIVTTVGSTEELHIFLAIYNIRSQVTYQSVFHDLAGYNAHLFIRELAKYTTGMGVIAKNTEDYISFSIKVEVNKYVDNEGNGTKIHRQH